MGARKKDKGNEPWIDNYPPLKAWVDRMIEDHGAFWMWQHPLGKTGCYIERLQVGRHAVLVIVYPDRHGWEIWTTNDSNRVDETLADVERRIGLLPKDEG